MFTEVDSFYSFPLTGIIPLEFKLLKSSSLCYLKGSLGAAPLHTDLLLAGGGVAGPGRCGDTDLKNVKCMTSSGSPGEGSSQLLSGLSLPQLSPIPRPVCTKGNPETGEGGMGGGCQQEGRSGRKITLTCHLQPGRGRVMPQLAHPGTESHLSFFCCCC